MGTEYDLFKPEKKERFDLGKGFWPSVFNTNGKPFILNHLHASPTYLFIDLLSHIAYSFEDETPVSYFKELAANIFNWCGTDEVLLYDGESFSEKYWEDWMKSYDSFKIPYPYTGTRVTKKETLQKPPLGLIPVTIHDRNRAFSIIEAMNGYIDKDKLIPNEWFEELKQLNIKLATKMTKNKLSYVNEVLLPYPAPIGKLSL